MLFLYERCSLLLNTSATPCLSLAARLRSVHLRVDRHALRTSPRERNRELFCVLQCNKNNDLNSAAVQVVLTGAALLFLLHLSAYFTTLRESSVLYVRMLQSYYIL